MLAFITESASGRKKQAHLHWLFFDCMVDPDSGRYLSEDYAFCRRWIDIGGKVPGSCFVLMQVKKGQFTRVWPKKKGTLDCNPKNKLTLKLDLIK